LCHAISGEYRSYESPEICCPRISKACLKASLRRGAQGSFGPENFAR
jgi:hypothetical protein